MADVAMPRLSDSMEEGTILKWLKSDGEEVKRGEELVEIETDKANMTYEADSDGALTIVAKEGDTLAVGETIARLGDASEGGGDDGGGEQADTGEPQAAEDVATDPEEEEKPAAEEEGEEEKPAAEEEEEEEEEEEKPAAEEDEEPSGNGKPIEAPSPAPARAEDMPSGNGAGDGRVKASPVAKRMAREMGVSLSDLQGSGPGGRIVKADVEAAAKGAGAATAEAPAPPREEQEPEEAAAEQPEKRDVPPSVTPPEGDGQGVKGEVTHQELSRLQKTIARRMAESKATAPDFVLNIEVDMEEAVGLRKQLKAAAGDQPAPSFNDFVIKAGALALRDFPRANGAYRDGKFELYSRVNVGVAVAGQDALVVPTIFDADVKSIGQIAREARAVAERVRAGAVTPPELSGGTFTVSNLGMFGIKRFTAVINPPQAAILAVGALEPRAVVRDGKVTVRPIMELTLACDHRILYGADAAEFLSRIREYLEQPLKLAL
ncbi:MAG TPA: dihydrolipoamide acetyltransferase family protein [Solirubrobacteraceae bacterium]|nr:dihydrolipoamide acetyltransferase family protein [Solirubrobacteraceae bacterium]